jgi:hypothetical protein
MSSYRCPVCGANHKDGAERCRLCGQSLAPGTVAAATPKSVARPARAQRGIKGVVLIGIGLIAGLIALAVLFGVLKDDRQVQKAKDLVSGQADGWSTQVEDEGHFEVALPGTRTRSTTAWAGTDTGTITAWQAAIGDDTEILAGYGHVTPPLKDGTISPALAQQYLRDTVAERWAAANGYTEATATMREGFVGGLPTLVIHTTQDRMKIKGKDAFAHFAMILRNDTIYVLQVVSIYKDVPQLERMVSSFVPTAY